MTGRLAGKVALITGTGSGIGCDINVAGAEETLQMVTDAGGKMVSQAPVDLADEGQVAAWVHFAIAEYGRIDVLYNNAGAFVAGPFGGATADGWHQSMRNEVDVVYFPTRAVWPHMIKAGGGSIINTASITAPPAHWKSLPSWSNLKVKPG